MTKEQTRKALKTIRENVNAIVIQLGDAGVFSDQELAGSVDKKLDVINEHLKSLEKNSQECTDIRPRVLACGCMPCLCRDYQDLNK